MAYDPFGAKLATAGSITTTQAWQSSTLDSASGLYYVIARWYSPTLGRFLSVDPVAGDGGSPQTLDRYSYGAGDSINRIDPDGRCAYNANTHQTEDTPGAPCVGAAKGYTGTFTPKPVAPGPGPGASVCAQSSYHAAGCGPAPSNPNYWNSTSPDLVSLPPGLGEDLRNAVKLNGGTDYDAMYIYCLIVGYGPVDCQNRVNDAYARANPNDGRCHEGLAGCFVLGAVSTLISPVIMGACVINEECRNSTIAHYASSPRFWLGYLSGGPLLGLGAVQAQDFADRLQSNIANGNWDDVSFQAGQVAPMIVGLKGLVGKGTLPDDLVVVHGGTQLPPAGTPFSAVGGESLAEAAAGVPHGPIQVSTVGGVRASGGWVEYLPELNTRVGQVNYQHLQVCLGPGACPFGDVIANPVPKMNRFGYPGYPYGWRPRWGPR